MFCVLIFIIFVYRCNFVCVCVYVCFSGMCLLFGHVCISIKATKATGGSQQCQQCKILFLSSDGGIFVFLSKQRKQQEVVEPQCSSYWPVATAAFLRPQHLAPTAKPMPQYLQCLPDLQCLRFLQYFRYFTIFAISAISARFAIFKFSTI